MQRFFCGLIAALLACTSCARAAQNDSSAPQGTTEAQSRAIEPRVRAFVNASLYVGSDEGVARWNSPACPTVLGLSRDDGEFVLERLSQIARTAGVPLAGQGCSATNLYVLATSKPVEFLRKWAKLQDWRMFGEAPPSVINAFIDTPRPLRVWYNSGEVGGSQTSEDAPAGAEPGGMPTVPTVVAHGSSSLGGRNLAWNLTAAIIVIDKTQLQGVTRGQLADDIAMHAFLRLKADVHRGDAPTILGLFDGTPAQSPRGLTEWDEAFLESLYHTDPKSALQRTSMVMRMADRIAAKAAAPQTH